MGSPVAHWELRSENADRTAGYETVLDWKNTQHPELNYCVTDPGGQRGAM